MILLSFISEWSYLGVIFRGGCTKGTWQIKGGGGGGVNDLFTTINADCLISCYENIIKGLGGGGGGGGGGGVKPPTPPPHPPICY